MKVSAVLVVFPAVVLGFARPPRCLGRTFLLPDHCVSGFSPLPRSKTKDQCLTRRFGAVEDVRDLLRDVRVYFRAWLLPVLSDELFEMVTPDYASIGDSLLSGLCCPPTQFELFNTETGCSVPCLLVSNLSATPKALVLSFIQALWYRQRHTHHYIVASPSRVTTRHCSRLLLLSLADVDLADEVIRYYGNGVRLWFVSCHSMGRVLSKS